MTERTPCKPPAVRDKTSSVRLSFAGARIVNAAMSRAVALARRLPLFYNFAMRVLGALLAVLPFTPPAGFTQLLPHPVDYIVSPFVYKESTHEYIVAEAFPTVTSQSDLVKAMHAIRQQFRDLPQQLGTLDQPATICGAPGVHGSYEYVLGAAHEKIEHWQFISGHTGYSILYSRPSKRPADPAVVSKLLKFCPGDESQMQNLQLTGFEIGGPARHYHLQGDWVSRTLGGEVHELVYLYGTDLEFDPSMHASWLKGAGFRLNSTVHATHCGSPLQIEKFTYGTPGDGIVLQREYATVYARTSVLMYTYDSSVPPAPQAENALRTFCVPHAPLMDFSGSWGGAGAKLVVGGRTADFTSNCFSGAMLISGPNLGSPDGHEFDVQGTMLSGSTEREVRYSGVIAGNRMRLRVTSLTGKVLATFDLKHGSHGDFHPCAAGR